MMKEIIRLWSKIWRFLDDRRLQFLRQFYSGNIDLLRSEYYRTPIWLSQGSSTHLSSHG